MDTLDSLSGISLAPDESISKPVEIEITSFIEPRVDKDGNPLQTFLYWQEPDTKKIYKMGRTVEQLLARNPEWEELLAMHVAAMSILHTAPATGGLAPGLFYEKIANGRNPKYFHYLMAFLYERFPHIGNALPTDVLKKILPPAVPTSGNSESPPTASLTPGNTP